MARVVLAKQLSGERQIAGYAVFGTATSAVLAALTREEP